jgi:hypothetical protein
MASEFPPSREAELVPFSENFKAKIAASPGDFSLTSAQATAYGTLHDDFIAKWDVCQDPTTKTKQAVELKDQAKNALLGNLRMLVKIVQNAPTTTNAERIELNIPERDFEPTPVPPPADAPMLTVVSVYGRNIRIKLSIRSSAPIRRLARTGGSWKALSRGGRSSSKWPRRSRPGRRSSSPPAGTRKEDLPDPPARPSRPPRVMKARCRWRGKCGEVRGQRSEVSNGGKTEVRGQRSEVSNGKTATCSAL